MTYLPLPLSDIPIIPRLLYRHCHPPASLLNSSSHNPPFPHAFHCCCVNDSLPCLLRRHLFHFHISTSNVLIKPSISSYTVTVPCISTTVIFASICLFSHVFYCCCLSSSYVIIPHHLHIHNYTSPLFTALHLYCRVLLYHISNTPSF